MSVRPVFFRIIKRWFAQFIGFLTVLLILPEFSVVVRIRKLLYETDEGFFVAAAMWLVGTALYELFLMFDEH